MFRLPLVPLDELPAASTQSETYRHLLSLAIAEGSPPEEIELNGLPSTMIRLPIAMSAKVEAIAEARGLSFKQVFAGLCVAGVKLRQARTMATATAAEKATKGITPPFTPKSDLQKLYFEHLMASLMTGRIAMAEGSTGIGKGRAIVAAALVMARQGKGAVTVAAPTIAVMEQLYLEFCALDPAQRGAVRARMLPGAAEFVDDVALKEHLAGVREDPELTPDEAVEQWVASGGKPLDPNRPLARSIGKAAAWLTDDLRRIATTTPIEAFSLRSGKPMQDANGHMGEAVAILDQVRECSRSDADVVFCTHAMLAIMQLSQWRFGPEPAVLIVDEAHLLEHAVATINTHAVSLYSLRVTLSRYVRSRGLGAGSAAKKAVKVANELQQLIGNLEATGTQYTLSIDGPDKPHLYQRILENVGALAKLLASKGVETMPHAEHFREGLRKIHKGLGATGEARTDRVDVSYSPDRRYPSLQCGPSSVGPQLGSIWKEASEGVALASATLYVMDAFGNTRGDYMRGLLALPWGRVDTPLPVVDPAIYRTPVLYTPSAAKCSMLIPPSKEQDAEPWHAAVAASLASVATSAAGGTLALCTAYRDIDALRLRLLAAHVPEDRVIAQQPNVKLSATLDAFRAAHAKGLRPVMLGLGGAWTGIDLTDPSVPPERDNLLTDLVIVRMPVGLNRTNSALARIERSGTASISNEALLTFKQGLGRLIRRTGVTDRRIWILDGRIFGSWNRMPQLTGAARRLLREYIHQQTF